MDIQTMRQTFAEQAFLYYPVTEQESKNITVDHWVAPIDGQLGVATNEPVEQLAAKEIK